MFHYMKQELKNIAIALDDAARSSKAIPQISLSAGIDLKQAYAIQKESIARRHMRGEMHTGYKLGFTSKAKMEQMGVHDLIWGRLTSAMIIENNTLSRDKFIHPRVEPEIAFRVGKKIDNSLSLAQVPDYLSGVAIALEVIDSRYENFKFSLEDVIADNCSSAAYIIGDWHPVETNVNNVNIRLNINDKENQTGNSNAILGNPLESMVEISRILSAQGIVLEPGEVILAGAATSAVYINQGDKIEGHFDGLGHISFEVI